MGPEFGAWMHLMSWEHMDVRNDQARGGRFRHSGYRVESGTGFGLESIFAPKCNLTTPGFGFWHANG